MLGDDTILPAELRNLALQLSYLFRTARLIWSAARGWTLAWSSLLIVQGLLPAATVYLTRLLVDSLVVTMGTGSSWETIRPTLMLAALMAAVVGLTELAQSAGNWVRSAQAEFVRDHISTLIHQKAAAVDMAFYESSAYHDRLERVHHDLSNRPLALLESSGSLLQNALTLLAMGTLLIPYGVWLPVVLVASTLPALYIVVRFNRRHHQWWEETTADRRRTQYYNMALTASPFAAELRVFDLGPYFRSAFQALRQRLRTEHLDLTRSQSLAQLGAGVLAAIVTGAVMLWMLWRAFLGVVTLGDLALFYQAFNRGQSLLRTLLGNLGQIYSNALFLGNLFEFLELEPQVVDPPHPCPAPSPLQQGIRFRDVTFRYPGSELAVLEDFNFTIPAGKIVAVVGANGAGKTTLTKLLCRFYDPEAGSIELDGDDIRALSIAELRRMITILFQFPVPYFVSAAENIAMGDRSATPGVTEIEATARRSGIHNAITHLPQGYETQLGKWFADGTDLSTGEWQRLALARAFLRRADIMILDEPTSFLDSWAEIDWFDRFRELANGRTALLITHRFTIARHADIIHVMDQGRMVESGCHDELLAQGGRYAQSWTAQLQSSPSLSNSKPLPGVLGNSPHLDGLA